MTLYVGLVDGADGAWGVVVPDFPGCHGGGATIEAAVQDATTALRAFAAQMLADGETLPKPGDLKAVQDANETGDALGSMAIYIRLVLDKSRPVRANISLDAGLLEAIDQEAKRRGLTRSGFLASAAMDEIARGS
jgi:predicted RNase H-like HicB family nuclease